MFYVCRMLTLITTGVLNFKNLNNNIFPQLE